MSTDLLVLGTGVSGRQTIRYLQSHPDRASFTFAIAGRSESKLNTLVSELSLPNDVRIHIVDVKNAAQLEAAVKTTKVVVNTVGPFWFYGSPVVAACVRNRVHYADLTGEAPWVKHIITEYDFNATKSGAIIVPCCGLDCIPSDISAYLGRKTIASSDPENIVLIGESTAACKISGVVSGGTAATIFTMVTQVPRNISRWARSSHALSPIVGIPHSSPKLFYTLTVPTTRQTLLGGIHLMASIDRAIVERTWGLFEQDAILTGTKESERQRYGPDFKYDEFMVMPSKIHSYILSLGLGLGLICMIIPPLRFIVKALLPAAGAGPKDNELHQGLLSVTNVTTSTSGNTQAVTTFKAKGDPGYYLSCIMVAECGLALLEPHKLSKLAQRGGILTPATAFGDVIVSRLKATKTFQISSELVQTEK